MATGSYNGQTTNKTGTFSVQSDGFIQGMLRNDPVGRYSIAQGIWGPNETYPAFGGMAIQESIPGVGSGATNWPNANSDSLGSVITRATTAANISGFAVFDQSFAAPITPFSNVPLIGSGQSVNYIRLGDSQQLAVAIDPSFAALLIGGTSNQQVTWDLNAQRLAPYNPSGNTILTTSITPTFVPAANGQPAYWNMAVVNAANTSGVPGGIGDVVNLTGFAVTSSFANPAGVAYINQNQVVTSFTSATNWAFKIQNTSNTLFASGVAITSATTGVTTMPSLAYSGGLLTCKILRIDVSNSKNVIYNAQNNTANWQNGLACALIQV